MKSLGTEKVGDGGLRQDRSEHHEAPAKLVSVARPRSDHLPRKLKEIVRVSYDLIIDEDWSSVTVNGDIPDTMFAWKPPTGWTQWKLPPIEAGLLKPGTKAPDFELASADGKADQAVGLSRPGRMVLRLEGRLTDLPRGDVSSPRTLCASTRARDW